MEEMGTYSLHHEPWSHSSPHVAARRRLASRSWGLSNSAAVVVAAGNEEVSVADFGC